MGAAARLFDALHALDAADLSRIVAEPIPDTGLGRAVMDRLRRAARGATAIGGDSTGSTSSDASVSTGGGAPDAAARSPGVSR